jgi:hypothetical protein
VREPTDTIAWHESAAAIMKHAARAALFQLLVFIATSNA